MGRAPLITYQVLLDPKLARREGWAEHLICKYCGGRVDPPKRAWCSRLCVLSFGLLIDWGQLRRFVWERDRGRCVECGKYVPLNRPSRPMDRLTLGKEIFQASAEIDHIIEVTDGGKDEPSNLQTLCHDCHSKKTTRAARARRNRAIGQGQLFEEVSV